MKATITRLAILLLLIVNYILSTKGLSPIPLSDDQVTELISLIAMLGSTAWCSWKNNSFTENAKKADKYLQDLKGSDK